MARLDDVTLVAQETLLAVWRKAALFDPAKASASTWIATIARNLRIEKLADVEAGDPMTRINDGRADRDGGFVFGTKSEHPDGRRAGRWYQYTAMHGLRELALPQAAIPNSICFDASGTRLYFCDSVEPRIMTCLYHAASARVSDVRVFAELRTPGAEPDGSIVDAEGALWNAQWGAGQVVRYLADGRIDRVVQVPASQPSCCVLRGDSLYVTSARVGLSDAQLAAQPGAGGVERHAPLARAHPAEGAAELGLDRPLYRREYDRPTER